MGCLQSKAEVPDLHPNIFHVTNVDQNGVHLCTGTLEITENDLILYRDGRDSTVWPLHSLRRYGFEEGMFSFESGRRCETGEGIYAFKCRRASILFRNLQHQILLRNAMTLNTASRLQPSPQGRQTLQASVVHRSSIDNGQSNNMGSIINSNLPNIISDTVGARNVAQSPRSPSSADILEVMPLYPRPQNASNHVTNVYQLRHIKREHNNNHNELHVDNRHVYSNDLIRDLAALRSTLQHETSLNILREIEDESRFLESVAGSQINANFLSPPPKTANEQYAQLGRDLQQLQQQQQDQIEQQDENEQQDTQHQETELLQQQSQQDQQQKGLLRLYMNITPSETIIETSKSDTVPTTPISLKPIEYYNLTIGNRPELNTYANLSLGEIGDCIKNVKHTIYFSSSDYKHKMSEFDSMAPLSPVEETEVNYAVLDIDCNKEVFKTTRDLTSCDNASTKSGSVMRSRGRLVSQTSTDKSNAANAPTGVPAAAIGYTTIDFDKTVALTSVAAGEEISAGVEGCRKTRHNSCNIIYSTSSLATNDKGKN